MSDIDGLEAVLAAVWERLSRVMEQHYAGGRQHLLTEDVVRFATVVLLEEHGIPPQQLAIETTIPGAVRGKLDLTIGVDVAIEFKFPRDPHRDVGAADTMTFGELLADVYRLAALPYRHRLAVWLIHDRLAAYLARMAARHEIGWPTRVGDLLLLPAALKGRLPATAAAVLPEGRGTLVRAHALVHRRASSGLAMIVLQIVDPAPAPWPPKPVQVTIPQQPAPLQRAGRNPAGARREILDAIDTLAVRSGSPLFTVRDVVDELGRRGTRYAVSTITTMITSHMCVDGYSVTEWPDLRRVDRVSTAAANQMRKPDNVLRCSASRRRGKQSVVVVRRSSAPSAPDPQKRRNAGCSSRAVSSSSTISRSTAWCQSSSSPAVGASSYVWWCIARDSPYQALRATLARGAPANAGNASNWWRITHPAIDGATRFQYSWRLCSSAMRTRQALPRCQHRRVPGVGSASNPAAKSRKSRGITAPPAGLRHAGPARRGREAEPRPVHRARPRWRHGRPGERRGERAATRHAAS